jgi:putative intracellular protease/amidase
MGTTIGIVLFPELEELDAVGPWEVFTMAAKQQEFASSRSRSGRSPCAARRGSD